MKIFTAMYTMRRGGSYDRFRMMLEAFLERGCEVHCLSLTPIPLNYAGYQNHVVRIPIRMQKPFVDKLAVLFLFPFYALWIGRQEKVDLFIAFGTLYAFVQSISKRILRKPMVTFLRGSFAFGGQIQGQRRLILWLNQMIEKIGIHFSDTILSVNSTISEDMRRVVGGRKGQRWEVLPNNIPSMPIPENQDMSLRIRKVYGIPEDAKIMVTAGLINRGKNIELLIRSLPSIGFDNLILLVIGDGSTEADMKHQASLKILVNNLRLGNRVIFTGWLEKDELWKMFYGCDLFVLPSRSEGMPNVMLEALGCDLPCLGSDVSGIGDILNYDQLIFDPTDEKTLGNKIQNFFTSPKFFHEVKSLCQERKNVFTFDWKKRVFEMIARTPAQLLGWDS